MAPAPGKWNSFARNMVQRPHRMSVMILFHRVSLKIVREHTNPLANPPKTPNTMFRGPCAMFHARVPCGTASPMQRLKPVMA